MIELILPTVVLGFGVDTAGGLDGEVIRWFDSRVAVELNADAAPNIGDGSDILALQKAMDRWNSVACADVQLTTSGLTARTETALDSSALDDVNRLTWVRDNAWAFGPLVLAVTVPVFETATGRLVESDIAFNGIDPVWRTDGTSTADIEAIAVHELGHLLGLQHVLGGNDLAHPPTMSPAATVEMRSLERDDESGLCYLYPVSYRCLDDCDCPTVVKVSGFGDEFNAGQFTCVQGACSGTKPSGGAICQSDYVLTAGTAALERTVPETVTSPFECACDTTTVCDGACSCDPECAGGCTSTPVWPGIAFFALLGLLRRRSTLGRST
ncbi:MAG: matrixin family metalloprotease [Myxococcota bacterium]